MSEAAQVLAMLALFGAVVIALVDLILLRVGWNSLIAYAVSGAGAGLILLLLLMSSLGAVNRLPTASEGQIEPEMPILLSIILGGAFAAAYWFVVRRPR